MRWTDRLIPPLAYRYIRALRVTMRLRYDGREHVEAARAATESGRFVLAFWHSRFVMMPYVERDPRLVALLSHSRDAQLLRGLLERFGYRTVHGSSSRGGVGGMRALVRSVRDGYDLGIAPDGPRGPRRIVKPGVVAAARWTGLPILPVTFSAGPAKRLRSWDHTLVPNPFSKGRFVFGAPIDVPRHADDLASEAIRVRLEGVLNRMTDDADRATGVGPEPGHDGVEAAA